MLNFLGRLKASWLKQNSLVCVGLDSDLEKIPDHLRSFKSPLFEFNRAIIDATSDLVCAYKPQIAFYTAVGLERDLEQTISYIHEQHPDLPVILDAKRGDIGSTSRLYAQEIFERYGADAVTVNPYLGGDSLEPFLKWKDKGVIILCRTSNPGAGDIQDLDCQGEKLYRIVARKAVQEWNQKGNVLLVVGATYPQELSEIRSIVGDMPLLVPGIGVQGGDIERAVINGKSADGTGMIINSSRGIIYASQGNDFAEAARAATLRLKDEINRYR